MKDMEFHKQDIMVEIQPREWLIDCEQTVTYRVFDMKTGLPLPNARIIGGSGNVRINGFTDKDGVFETTIEHKMMGSTPHIVMPFGWADGACSNTKLTNGWFGEENCGLPKELNVGQTYSTIPNLKSDWNVGLIETIYLKSGDSKEIKFNLNESTEKLHFLIRWYGIKNNVSMTWRAPDGGAYIASQRVKISDSDIQPLVAQPNDEGLINNPKQGEWKFNIKRNDQNPETCKAVLEVYKKYEAPKIPVGTLIRVYGAGVNIQHTISDETEKPIEFTPTSSGTLTIVAENPGIIRTVNQKIEVI